MTIGPWGFLAIALVVFVVWRLACRRWKGGDIARERVVVALFVYLLALACVTFFPMHIIFYDWHGRFNLVPFAGIIDLVRHETSAVARMNIGGNIAMFVPLGLLLPLLFRKLRSLGPLVWRVAAISAGIEILQLLTRVRSTDIDDIILNVTGAVVGYGMFRLVGLLAARRPRAAAFLDRVGSDAPREPLLAGLVPVALTILLTLGLLIVPGILENTLDERAIREDVVSGIADASVVASAEGGGYELLVAASTEADSEVFCWAEYKRVLPGRYTKRAWSEDVHEGVGSCYTMRSTTYDTHVEDGPVTYVVGRNDSGAATLAVTAEGMTGSFEASIGSRCFVVVLPDDPDIEYLGAKFAFRDASGHDVKGLFNHE